MAINHLTTYDVDDFTYHLDAITRVNDADMNTIDLYAELVSKSAIYPGQGTPFGLMYVALGLAEGGEVQNKVKKMFRDDGVIEFLGEAEETNASGPGERLATVVFREASEARKQQIVKELGGLFWYAVVLCKELGIAPSDVLLQNITELAGRTERGTLAGDGDNR